MEGHIFGILLYDIMGRNKRIDAHNFSFHTHAYEECKFSYNQLSTFPVQRNKIKSTKLFMLPVLCILPGVANRTKPNQKPIELNLTQSIGDINANRSDCCSIGLVIERNRTETSRSVRLPNSVEPIEFNRRR